MPTTEKLTLYINNIFLRIILNAIVDMFYNRFLHLLSFYICVINISRFIYIYSVGKIISFLIIFTIFVVIVL